MDTKIYLFSRRNSAGDICKPRALYANSVVLKSVPYFDDCICSPECFWIPHADFSHQPVFSGNYSESATKDLDEDATDEDEIAEYYDYDSDSDLEDAEDLDMVGGLDDCTADDRSQDTNRYELSPTWITFLI